MSEYTYLGVDFASNGSWDGHIKKMLDVEGSSLIPRLSLHHIQCNVTFELVSEKQWESLKNFGTC